MSIMAQETLNCAPSHKPTALELQRTMLNWQQQQRQPPPPPPQNQSMWFYGLQPPLTLGQNFTAAAYSASQQYPTLEDHKLAVTVSQNTLPNISATGDAVKKRRVDAKRDSSDENKKKKIDADVLEMPELESNSNQKKEASESGAPKSTDFIHVRARRGQATDSHSLAERVRREKISERMKYLQDLVPGCSNTTGKASVLDEIINYVQSLQKQVEFLSMKLAAVSPPIECNMQSFMGREIVIKSSCSTSISKEMSVELLNSSYPLVNSLQTAGIPSNSAHGGITLNLAELNVFRKTTSVPGSVPVAFSEPYFDVCGSSAWDYNAQSLQDGLYPRKGNGAR